MRTREGNLEATTRHAVHWKSEAFNDEDACLTEMDRVVDICHCRRYISLCQSFPPLFDLVDATENGEVHGVKKEACLSVVDQCYLSDLCFMTKCPTRRRTPGSRASHPDAWMPELAAKRFRWAADQQGQAVTVVDGPRSPGKVAIFATCYFNYNAPGIGHDRVKVLEHNAFPFVIVENGSGHSLGCSRWGSVVAFGAGARPR